MATRFDLSRLPIPLRWLLLIALSALVGQTLDALSMPAGQFIGPMVVAIVLAILGISLRLPRLWFKLGQGAIGMLISQTLSIAVLTTIVGHWPLMVAATALTLAFSYLVGVVSVRYGGMPGTTAAWGTTPGAAAAMVAMAEENDADPRIVAAMQYVRVICVVLIGALVGHVFSAGEGSAVKESVYSFELFPVAASLAVLVVGSLIGQRLLPAGALLGPVLLATPLHLLGLVEINLPAPLLAIAYAAIGCYVGLRFDRPTVRYVMRSLPWMVFASLLLIALCAFSAWLVLHFIATDYLSLYLATSPGGLDSMTIIAIDTQADVGLVAALQVMRLFAVILIGRWMASSIARFAIEER